MVKAQMLTRQKPPSFTGDPLDHASESTDTDLSKVDSRQCKSFPGTISPDTSYVYKHGENNTLWFSETWKLPWDAAVAWIMDQLFKTPC